MSFKSRLHELFQKQNMKMPTFTHEPIPKDNIVIWKASVRIDDHAFEAVKMTKKIAEQECSKQALEYLANSQHKPTSPRPLVSNPFAESNLYEKKMLEDIKLDSFQKIVLIDGENFNFKSFENQPEVLILIFVAKNTSKKIVVQLQDKFPNVYLFISKCVGKDAADHLLTFYAGKLSILRPNASYSVVTKDHYGEFLEHFLPDCKFIS